MQTAGPQIREVDVGDLILTATTRLQVAGDRHNVVVVEVQARDGIVTLRLARLFLKRDSRIVAVELDHPVRGGFSYPVGENCTTIDIGEAFELRSQAGS